MDELYELLASAKECGYCGRYVDQDEPHYKTKGDFPGPIFHELCASVDNGFLEYTEGGE